MSLPATFKAALLPETGAQHVVTERSLPALKSGEVAIKVTAAAVNPVDWKIRERGFLISSWPTVLGSDAAGEVAALGPDVRDLAVGDRVFFQGMLGREDYCAFQQYCVMPADLLARTPRNVSDEQASGIALATVAVVVAFYDKTGRGLPAPWDEGGDKAGRGKAMVVIGGASSCGQYAIQLARISGFDRIVTTASPKHHEFLAGLGAHVTLDRHTASPGDFRDAVGDLPLDFVVDGPSSKETQIQAVEVLRAAKTQGGSVVTLMGVDEEARKLAESNEPKIPTRQTVGIGWDPKLMYLSKPMVKHLGGEDGWVAKGVFVPNRVRVVKGGLANLEEALGEVERGVSGEKIIIRPWDE